MITKEANDIALQLREQLSADGLHLEALLLCQLMKVLTKPEKNLETMLGADTALCQILGDVPVAQDLERMGACQPPTNSTN